MLYDFFRLIVFTHQRRSGSCLLANSIKCYFGGLFSYTSICIILLFFYRVWKSASLEQKLLHFENLCQKDAKCMGCVELVRRLRNQSSALLHCVPGSVLRTVYLAADLTRWNETPIRAAQYTLHNLTSITKNLLI